MEAGYLTKEDPVRGAFLKETAQAKIYDPHAGNIGAGLDQDVLRLDVAVKDLMIMKLFHRVHQLFHYYLREGRRDKERRGDVETKQWRQK